MICVLYLRASLELFFILILTIEIVQEFVSYIPFVFRTLSVEAPVCLTHVLVSIPHKEFHKLIKLRSKPKPRCCFYVLALNFVQLCERSYQITTPEEHKPKVSWFL